MAKKIKVVVTATIELPDSAEVIQFKDEEGIKSDHIKFGGHLIRPDIAWMEYISSDVMKKQNDHPALPALQGIGWTSVPDEIYDKLFAPADWYLEELS